MDSSLPFTRMIPLVGLALISLISHVDCQSSNPCSPSLLASFTPCFDFITNSTANGTSPTSDCCNSLKTITSTSMDCVCQMFTGSVPFQVPINRTLAISLPRACNMAGVPVQCKAASAPFASPGPVSLGPTSSPVASPPASPSDSAAPEPTPSAQPPESDTTPVLTPPSTTVGAGVPPTSSTGIRPILTSPSVASASCSLLPSLVLLPLGFVLLKYC